MTVPLAAKDHLHYAQALQAVDAVITHGWNFHIAEDGKTAVFADTPFRTVRYVLEWIASFVVPDVRKHNKKIQRVKGAFLRQQIEMINQTHARLDTSSLAGRVKGDFSTDEMACYRVAALYAKHEKTLERWNTARLLHYASPPRRLKQWFEERLAIAPGRSQLKAIDLPAKSDLSQVKGEDSPLLGHLRILWDQIFARRGQEIASSVVGSYVRAGIFPDREEAVHLAATSGETIHEREVDAILASPLRWDELMEWIELQVMVTTGGVKPALFQGEKKEIAPVKILQWMMIAACRAHHDDLSRPLCLLPTLRAFLESHFTALFSPERTLLDAVLKGWTHAIAESETVHTVEEDDLFALWPPLEEAFPEQVEYARERFLHKVVKAYIKRKFEFFASHGSDFDLFASRVQIELQSESLSRDAISTWIENLLS